MRQWLGVAVGLASCASSGQFASGAGDGVVVHVDAGQTAPDAAPSTADAPAPAESDAASTVGADAEQGAAANQDAAGPDAAGAGADAGPAPLDLRIGVSGAKSASGSLCAVVAASGEGFPGSPKASVANTCVPFAQLPVVIQGLTPGATYGISVFLDLNGNQKLDQNAFDIPLEGFGFSNNPAIGFGPPNWDAVKFVLGPSTAQPVLKLTYLL